MNPWLRQIPWQLVLPTGTEYELENFYTQWFKKFEAFLNETRRREP